MLNIEPEIIYTERLKLIPFKLQAIDYLLRSDYSEASQAQGLLFSFELVSNLDKHFLEIQLKRIEQNPKMLSWCARLIVDKNDVVIGHCGFHGPPKVIGRAELGYTVFEPYRRNGFATEAANGLINYARNEGEHEIIATVKPNNSDSISILSSLGFNKIGEEIDERDGLELVYQLSLI